MARIANEAAEVLGIPTRLEASEIHNTLDYVGPGYGVVILKL